MLHSVQSSDTCSVVKVEKGKLHPRTVHEGQEGEYMYRSTLSLASALDGVWVINTTSWLLFLWERYPVLIVQEAGWAPGQSGRVRKISPELSLSVLYLHHKHSEVHMV